MVMATTNRKVLSKPIMVTNNPVAKRGPHHECAVLEINDENGGLLLPRMTSAQRDMIPNPVAGLMIYNSETNNIEIYTDTGASAYIWAGGGGSGSASGHLTNITYDPLTNELVSFRDNGTTTRVSLNDHVAGRTYQTHAYGSHIASVNRGVLMMGGGTATLPLATQGDEIRIGVTGSQNVSVIAMLGNINGQVTEELVPGDFKVYVFSNSEWRSTGGDRLTEERIGFMRYSLI